MERVWEKDEGYREVIRESGVLKNVVKVWGVRREEEEEGGGRGGVEEGVNEGRRRGIEKYKREMSVREKVRVLELLISVVKGGVEMEDEEGVEEVVMRLEEEGRKYREGGAEEEGGGGEGGGVEEGEGEGEGGEGATKEKEMKEWEELNERVNEFMWVMEVMKGMGEGERMKNRKEREEQERERRSR